jgi:opacity protein-like surface antigen
VRQVRQRLLILALITFLALAGAQPPVLAGLHPTLDLQNLGGWALALEALSFAGYYMYKNSPAQRARGYEENLGPGEWYLGAYSGLSYLPPADWQFTKGWPPGIAGRTAQNINYEAGIIGGLKFGRYFDTLPWFGLEGETNFSHNNIRAGTGRISPPLPAVSGNGVGAVGGTTRLFGGSDWFDIWVMRVNLMARYGFLKDKEVTFGRLQPYVGIGPGWEVVYARVDSAKNFAIEAQAGIRYMCTPNVAIFFEYKFSYQFQVEYQNFNINKQSPESQGRLATIQTLSFDLPHHNFVIGVSYHFKNLYGN